MAGMTSRERLLAALSHRQPDRVPLDLGGTRNSTMVVEGYERLKAHCGIATPTKIIERMMRVVEADEGVLRALAIDTRGVFPGGPTRGLAADLGPQPLPGHVGSRADAAGGQPLLRPGGVAAGRRHRHRRHPEVPVARSG